MNIQVCNSVSDAVALYLPQNLFLKPVSKINISIQLPSSKALGKTISNWELMERMREMIRPDLFSSLKVTKSSADAIRFEGELDDRKRISSVVSCLDERSVKLNGYPEPLKLKASEAKLDFPSRHSWDSFFRDTPTMDEMKPGERPDTIHISNLPIKWFVSSRDLRDEDAKPSESIFRRVFEKFGKVRCVDIPICDPYRKQMKAHMTGISKFSYDSELYFEGYVQFSEYMGFVRAMDAFRGMKLLWKGEGGGHAVTVNMDFDKTKHLSEATIKRRSIVRERLVTQERAREEKEKEETLKLQKKEEAERRKRDQSAREKLSHMQEREERRKAKQLAKLKQKESSEINSKIAEEQKKLLRTQRKLQSIRLIEELFRRIQLKQKHTTLYKRDALHINELKQNNKDKKKELKKIEKALLHESEEKTVRDRLVSKYKSAQEQELEQQRLNLRKAIEGKIVLRSVLDTGKKKARTPSISSLSSGSEISLEDLPNKRIKAERLTTPERIQMIKEEDGMMRGYPPSYPGYAPYGPYMNPTYNYHQPPGQFYPRGGYYPPPVVESYGRGRGFTRRPRGARRGGGYRGIPRMPYFDGPNAHHAYYKYFKKLTEESGDRNSRDSYSRSRSRSRRRSYSRSRSRSYSRSRSRRRSSSRHRSRYSRSRSRSRSRNRRTRSHSRSRSRHSRSRSRHSRPRSRHSRSRSRHSRHSRSKSHKSKSRSRSRHKRSRSRHSHGSKSRNTSPTEKSKGRADLPNDKRSDKTPESKQTDKERGESSIRSRRSKSWSLPKDSSKGKSWSKSPPTH